MFKKSKLYLSRILKKGEKLYHVMVITALTLLTTGKPVLAGQPKLVSGTVALFNAGTGWLLVLIPVAAGCVLGYTALQKSLTDDHAVVAEKNKMMKNVLIGAAIAESAAGLVTAVLAFYS